MIRKGPTKDGRYRAGFYSVDIIRDTERQALIDLKTYLVKWKASHQEPESEFCKSLEKAIQEINHDSRLSDVQ